VRTPCFPIIFLEIQVAKVTTQKFKATVSKAGSRVFIPIPFDPNQVWGQKSRHDITGSINGCSVRGPLEQDGSTYRLALGPAWRRDNGLDAGDKVNVELAAEGPQVDALAPDIASALNAEPQARAFFEGLPTFYRKNFMRPIESAKRPETRARNIAAMVALLKAGRREK
jgi:hypothetical protein